MHTDQFVPPNAPKIIKELPQEDFAEPPMNMKPSGKVLK